jgi:hypothetical protein
MLPISRTKNKDNQETRRTKSMRFLIGLVQFQLQLSDLLRITLNQKRLRCPSGKKIEQETSKSCQKFEYLTLLNTFWNANKCERRGAREDNR